MKRNKYLEMDGLLSETDTHEWFLDKLRTHRLQTNTAKHGDNSFKDYFACVVRDKSDGKYMRVILDNKNNKVIYEHGSLEFFGAHIDILKVSKDFKCS